MKNPEPHVIAVANLKGGVGKTTTAVSLAAGLALRGRRTLLVDLDAQASATLHFIDEKSLAGAAALYDLLAGRKRLSEATAATHLDRLALLSAGDRRDLYQTMAAGAGGLSELALRGALAGAAAEGFGYVVLDTPPAFDFFTLSALAASQWVLVPVTCEYLPLLGLKQFNQALAAAKERLGLPVQVIGYLMTMVDRREKITWEVEEILRRTFGSQLLESQIRIDTKVKATPSFRKTIFEFEPEDGRSRSDYTALTSELIRRIESRYRLGIV